jgi:hypothetical protein
MDREQFALGLGEVLGSSSEVAVADGGFRVRYAFGTDVEVFSADELMSSSDPAHVIYSRFRVWPRKA